MLAAVESGDAKKVAELMRQDPGFKVNMDQDEHGRTLLHFACRDDSRSAVIPLLLAHPDIDVNTKDVDGRTPYFWACRSTSCVREMLKDSRVKVNEPANIGTTPLWYAASNGRLDVIKWWIVSGREMDLGTPGNEEMDAIGEAKKEGKTEVVALLERFKENPLETRHAMRLKPGGLCLGWVTSIKEMALTPAARFFSIARRLPLELQMVLCFQVVGSGKEIIPGEESEIAFKYLARKF